MLQKDTFLIRRDLECDHHLWIVISKTDAAQDTVVIVNLTSYRDDKDLTCVITPGEHPRVSRKSLVMYSGARLAPRDKLNEGLRVGIILPQSQITENLLDRIIEGFQGSPHTSIEVLEFLASQRLIEL